MTYFKIIEIRSYVFYSKMNMLVHFNTKGISKMIGESDTRMLALESWLKLSPTVGYLGHIPRLATCN